jgi:hypothetical protein
MKDSIVDEVRKARAELFAKAGHDLATSARLIVPKGLPDNSPALQRRESRFGVPPVPKERLKEARSSGRFLVRCASTVPSGRKVMRTPHPALKRRAWRLAKGLVGWLR